MVEDTPRGVLLVYANIVYLCTVFVNSRGPFFEGPARLTRGKSEQAGVAIVVEALSAVVVRHVQGHRLVREHTLEPAHHRTMRLRGVAPVVVNPHLLLLPVRTPARRARSRCCLPAWQCRRRMPTDPRVLGAVEPASGTRGA